ncbi:MAG: N-6 DNA methylase [Pseudonocardiaceae bacterium]
MERVARAVLPSVAELDWASEPSSAGAMSPPTLAGLTTRALGAYYTPPTAARVLAQWALRRSGDRLLEPSMGEGAFLRAVQIEESQRGIVSEIWGVEIASDTYEKTASSGVIERSHAICSDFLEVKPFEVDAVIGNPPYVRLRNLPNGKGTRAHRLAERLLKAPMDPSGSVWMPFVLHSTEFLAANGRLALVLPYDLTYVRYARPLWQFLGARFGELRVIRVHERMFPDILQETVLLLADSYGGRSTEIVFEAYETVAQLGHARPAVQAKISILEVVAGERAFVEALLPSEAISLLHGRLAQLTVPARDLVTFNIG